MRNRIGRVSSYRWWIGKFSDVLRFDSDAMFISDHLDLLVKLFKIFVYCAHPSRWSLLVRSCLMLIAEVSSLLLIARVVSPFVIGRSLDGHWTVVGRSAFFSLYQGLRWVGRSYI
jgi:hypothetical protein